MSFNTIHHDLFARTKRLAFVALAGISCAVAGSPALAQSDEADAPVAAEPPEGSVGGFGDINLFPKRVIIDGRRQIATVGLYNKTTNSGDYEIEIIDMGMNDQGRLLVFGNGLTDAEQARVKTASPFLRYSPRRVRLRGSESQIIRLMARAGADVPPGEYRSHFKVTAIPDDEGSGFSIDDAIGGEASDGIGVTIQPRFGISIPVIVRIGDTTLDVGISNPVLLTARDGTQAIGITVTRSGTRSAFGDIEITARGADRPVAFARGVGVYPELAERKLVIPIDPETEPGTVVSGRTLTITYTDDDVEPGAKLAELTFVIP